MFKTTKITGFIMELYPLLSEMIAIIGNNDFPKSELAELRRLPKTKINLSFYRVLSSFNVEFQEDQEQQWSTVLYAISMLANQHDSTEHLGSHLAKMELSDIRLSKFLSAYEDSFQDIIKSLIRTASSKKAPINLVDLCTLLLTTNPEKQIILKRRIARDFFRTQHSIHKG